MKKQKKKMTSEQFENWIKKNNLFISKVHRRIRFKDIGVYILNSYKFFWIPRFFGMNHKFFIECGINWLGWMIEFQYEKRVSI